MGLRTAGVCQRIYYNLPSERETSVVFRAPQVVGTAGRAWQPARASHLPAALKLDSPVWGPVCWCLHCRCGLHVSLFPEDPVSCGRLHSRTRMCAGLPTTSNTCCPAGPEEPPLCPFPEAAAGSSLQHSCVPWTLDSQRDGNLLNFAPM